MRTVMGSAVWIVLTVLLIGSLLSSGPSRTPAPAASTLLAQIIETNPSPPIEKDPAPPIEQNPSPPIENDPTPPIDEDPSPPIEEQSMRPAEDIGVTHGVAFEFLPSGSQRQEHGGAL